MLDMARLADLCTVVGRAAVGAMDSALVGMAVSHAAALRHVLETFGLMREVYREALDKMSEDAKSSEAMANLTKARADANAPPTLRHNAICLLDAACTCFLSTTYPVDAFCQLTFIAII